jgi:hypothetical protein
MEHLFYRIIHLLIGFFFALVQSPPFRCMLQSGIKASSESEPAFSFRFKDKYSAAPVASFLFNVSSEAHHKEPRL